MNQDDFFQRPEPSRVVQKQVERLANAVQHGKLEHRANLCKKLGDLAASYLSERKISESLRTLDEQIQLGEQLVQEGQIEMRQELLWSVAPVIHISRALELDDEPIDRTPFFKRYFHCYESLSEEEFCKIKNEWALEMVDYAKMIEERGATPAAIAVLDETLKKIEPRFDPAKKKFTELNPFLLIYRYRGLWKYQIGDRTAAIDDLLQYEQFAIQAKNAIQEKRNSLYERNADFSEEDIQNGRLVLRVEAEDYMEFIAALSFMEDCYDTIFRLADVFAAGAEKEKALKYYDKALAVLDDVIQTYGGARLLTYAAPAEIPFRKGTLLLQFRDFEESLEQFDLAICEIQKLLAGKREEFADELENRYSEIYRYRSETLNHLKRFDEAKEALEESKRILARAPETLTKAQAAREKRYAEKMEGNPLMDLLSAPKPPERSSQETPPIKKPVKAWTERDLLIHVGSMHNEAMMDYQQGLTELHRGRWKAALKYLLKSRLILDSPIIHEIKEAKMNLFSIYASIGRAYIGVKEYDVAETWYNRALKQAQSLIDEGYSEFQAQYCNALDGLGFLYAEKEDADESVTYFEKAYESRDNYIQFLESGLEGLNREKLRREDHQRLMPIAKLKQEQVNILRMAQEQLCRLNLFDIASSWASQEIKVFNELMLLLPNPGDATLDYFKALASSIAVFLLQHDEDVDELYDSLTKNLAEPKDGKTKKTLEEIQKIFDELILQRLLQLMHHEKFYSFERTFKTISSLRRQGKKAEADELCNEFLAVVKESQETSQNEHRLIRAFWDKMAESLQNDWNDSEKENAVHQDEDSDEYKEYEKDFDDPSENYETLYAMLDNLTGGKSARRLLEKHRRGEIDLLRGDPFSGGNKTYRNESPKVGRNEPCPCGSGKKYKKCCGK
ncbi:MAG: SEC-C domain-containing protein [Planctomycetaceae bacterium]|jgi:tetratricopeptide (TPR) repeat protein|nr:SEC-C domain-containing protein [Planctomycetaceae bacterium]